MDPVWLELKENYIKRLELLQAILNITRQQEELIAAEDMESFERSLDRRQKMMDQVDELDASRDQVQKLFMLKNKNDRAGAGIADIKLLEDKIKATLSEIDSQNTQNQKQVKDKLEEYRKKVRETQQANRCLQSYSGTYPVDGMFFDTKK